MGILGKDKVSNFYTHEDENTSLSSVSYNTCLFGKQERHICDFVRVSNWIRNNTKYVNKLLENCTSIENRNGNNFIMQKDVKTV